MPNVQRRISKATSPRTGIAVDAGMRGLRRWELVGRRWTFGAFSEHPVGRFALGRQTTHVQRFPVPVSAESSSQRGEDGRNQSPFHELLSARGVRHEPASAGRKTRGGVHGYDHLLQRDPSMLKAARVLPLELPVPGWVDEVEVLFGNHVVQATVPCRQLV
jgi:hypothetical protein